MIFYVHVKEGKGIIMVERKPFNTQTVTQINDHIQERLAEVEQNFANESYPCDKAREIVIRIRFEPEESDVTEVITKIFSETKLPKRLGKRVNTVVRGGKILVELGPEETPLFANVSPIVREGSND